MFQYLKLQKERSLQYLEENAGKDSVQDNFHRGVCAGINEVLNMSAEDLTEIDPDD